MTELAELPKVGELAQVAMQGAQSEDDVDQPALVAEGEKGPVVKFAGIKASAGPDHTYRNGQHVTFSGEGVIVHVGKELSIKDGTEREIIKIQVSSTVVEAG